MALKLKSLIVEQQASGILILDTYADVMRETKNKMPDAVTQNTDVDETINSVRDAVCDAYIEFCKNMLAHAQNGDLQDLPWGSEINDMIAKIKNNVIY